MKAQDHPLFVNLMQAGFVLTNSHIEGERLLHKWVRRLSSVTVWHTLVKRTETDKPAEWVADKYWEFKQNYASETLPIKGYAWATLEPHLA
jgi:hypothetical protein